MNKKTYGEELFEKYLNAQSIPFKHEPNIDGSSCLIDFVIDHPTHGAILIEVKDITSSMFTGRIGVFDPYDPVREHIEEGQRKFKDFPDALCALALVVAPEGLADLQSPHVMLGSMYGDMGFTIPINVESGQADASQIRRDFLIGKGKMVRRSRFQNTRISALISLHNYHTFAKEAALYIRTDDGRAHEERWLDVHAGRTNISADPTPCVTVWENAVAKRRLPRDLFRGSMDAWWTADEGNQELSFIGERRLALNIDNSS
jgi:hypothetical protein